MANSTIILLKTIIVELNNNKLISEAKSNFLSLQLPSKCNCDCECDIENEKLKAYIILIKTFENEIITQINKYPETFIGNHDLDFFLTGSNKLNLYLRSFKYSDQPFINLTVNEITDLYSRYKYGQIISSQQQISNLINVTSSMINRPNHNNHNHNRYEQNDRIIQIIREGQFVQNGQVVQIGQTNRDGQIIQPTFPNDIFNIKQFNISKNVSSIAVSNQEQDYTTTVATISSEAFTISGIYTIIGNEFYGPGNFALPGMGFLLTFTGVGSSTNLLIPTVGSYGIMVYLALINENPSPGAAYANIGYIITNTPTSATVYFCIPNLTVINQNYFPTGGNPGYYNIYCQDVNFGEISIFVASSIYNGPSYTTNIIGSSIVLNASGTVDAAVQGPITYPANYANYVVSSSPNDYITVYGVNLDVNPSIIGGYYLHFLPIPGANGSQNGQAVGLVSYVINPIANGQAALTTYFSEPLGYITFQLNIATNATIINTAQGITGQSQIIDGNTVLANGLYVIYPQLNYGIGATIQASSGIQVLISYS